MFSKRLKEMRTVNNYSQSELAKLLGVTKQNISDWENEKSETSFEMLCKIAKVLDVTVGQLVGSEEY